MEDVWPWLASLPPFSDEPTPATVSLSPLTLAASPDGASIVMQADHAEELLTFSLSVHGSRGAARTLWMSGPCAASSPQAARLHLVAQLLDEVIDLSPVDLDAGAVSTALEAAGADGAAPFVSLALLLRLFWLCALDAPADAGFLFFRILGPEIERALACGPALAAFLRAVGPHAEERFMRSLGYMLAKWCLLLELQAGSNKSSQTPKRPLRAACFSYAAEVHGLWVLRGYAPVLAMPRVASASASVPALPHEMPEEPALRYGLAHQQLEAVAQLEYAVSARDPRFIRVGVRVDNIRLRVARLGLRTDNGEDGDDGMESERHFPSRVRLSVGPELGAAYAAGPSLGRSTGNPGRDVELTRTIKGGFFGGGGNAKGRGHVGGAPRIKAKMRSSARAHNRSWRWEQEAAGSAGVFEGVLCDPVTGTEVSAWRDGGGGLADPRNGMRRRYGGPGRAFSKMRGLVVAGDELPEEVAWRVGREMEGRTVRWRVGLRVWVSYLPNEVRSGHFDTRYVEWWHEVELPLVATGGGS